MTDKPRGSVHIDFTAELHIAIEGDVNQNDLILAAHYIRRAADDIIDTLGIARAQGAAPPKLAIARAIPHALED
jgi:hypothetical protein